MLVLNVTSQTLFPLVQIFLWASFSGDDSAEWKGMCLLTLVDILCRLPSKGVVPFYTPATA